MSIKSLLPSSILAKAYEYNSEYAWKPQDIPTLTQALKEKKIAVLGGEVWKKTEGGPTISSDISHWNSTQKNNDDSWDDYVGRTLGEMAKFVENLQKEIRVDSDTYINIEMVEKF